VPCGGDSGGALFLDTAAGEQLVGVIKGSDADCAQFGLAMRTDSAAAFLADASAAADATTSSGRPAFDPAADQCAATCADHADCPLGMLCLPERDAMHCGYRTGRVALYGDACATGDDCVPVGQGSERDCRRAAACPTDSDDPGCCSTGGAGASPVLALLTAIALFRRRLPR
jgi:hypothetical protein